MNFIARLAYIAVNDPHQILRVPKSLHTYITQWEMLAALTTGLTKAATTLDAPVDQLLAFTQQGAIYGEVQPDEARILLAKEMPNNVLRNKTISHIERLKLFSEIYFYASSSDSSSVERSTFTDALSEELSLYPMGFPPLDALTFIPHGAFVNILAKSSAGKTSTMLAMADACLSNGIVKRVVYYTLEMRASMLADRMKYLSALHNQLVIAGDVPLSDIERYVRSDTAIFIDYGDLLYVPGYNETRHKLEFIYRRFLSFAKGCAFLVNASQARPTDGELHMYSGNEASSKAHVPDIILGLSNEGQNDSTGYATLCLQLLKNRTGGRDRKIYYEFDFATLQLGRLLTEPVSLSSSYLDY